MSDNPSRPITIVLLAALAFCLISVDLQFFGAMRAALAAVSLAINGASQ